jgi:prepilin-type N-terminal cleavage/methylation domain-containing protein
MPNHPDSRFWVLDSRKSSVIYHLKSKICRQRRPGFTLIELLIVVALIGILSSIGVYSYQTAQAKARDAQRKNDLEAIKKAAYLYATDNDTFSPVVGSSWAASVANLAWGAEGSNPGSIGNRFTPTYIKSIPRDPRFQTNADDYYFRVLTADGDTLIISAKLENTNDPVLSSLNCTPETGRDYCVTE